MHDGRAVKFPSCQCKGRLRKAKSGVSAFINSQFSLAKPSSLAGPDTVARKSGLDYEGTFCSECLSHSRLYCCPCPRCEVTGHTIGPDTWRSLSPVNVVPSLTAHVQGQPGFTWATYLQDRRNRPCTILFGMRRITNPDQQLAGHKESATRR